MIRIKFCLLFALVNYLIVSPATAQKTHYKPYKTAFWAKNKEIIPGADQTYLYIDYLKGKNIGMVINQTSVIGKTFTLSVDSLVALGISVKKIFGPEHGFRGNASNGAEINSTIDEATHIPVISLYGNKHYKPTPDDLEGIDLVIFDIQDVGARFYTYLSTLQYVMEACAENNVELMIFDRPNPNGFYTDGPVLDTAYRSFVGLNPIPIAHGLTIGEYAQMINGEGWLKNHVQCKLRIIKVANYKHSNAYKLPVNPSPNLNTDKSVILYPSVCLFEGTTLSLGRGTMYPFLQIGHPTLVGKYTYSFKPVSIPGMSEDPPQKGKICYGIDLKAYNTDFIRAGKALNLTWLIELYKAFPDKQHFFNAYFTKLAGTEKLQQQIAAGESEKEIRKTWEPALSHYKMIRKKYLLYP
ncbi:exo-beta-N-acetylmuramidase NamZ family protein [Mucilaginibacter gotjawali]|uniref:Uncharacterized protein n=2 Tax=Mucilaginibacter gotjawali TaxID=1550579 RepID=A0A0X8X053_9SPHI|nr:DUF1343 domain-containing protein [Mucilaginibacter gotjawali]MBB3055309.1 uncharacterized protein YbbC (DUF1343 family) [Mucilaginibacter gotjawali]BAU53414.1 hypothetical protein MgSA37_01582 [Mucilaginibacter gotjawali]